MPDAIGMVLAFYRLVLEHTLSEEERSQILQTIEMFEVITQTQPDDYQSLEILKVAYHKLGKAEEALRTSRRLAEAYFNVGSFSLAMQECEAVLTVEPNAPEIVAMLGEIETRLQQAGQIERKLAPITRSSRRPAAATPLSQQRACSRSVDAAPAKLASASRSRIPSRAMISSAKFLVLQQMFPEDEVSAALETVKEANKAMSDRTLATSLLDKLCQDNDEKMEAVLSALIDRTKFAYVPLEYYDIDRQVVRMLPDDLTLGRLFVPFDLISRTIMVACCNPFDAAGARSGAAIARLHRHVVSRASRPRSSRRCRTSTGWSRGPSASRAMRSKSFGERIADVLIEDGLLLPNQLEEAVDIQKKQGGRLLKILTDKQFVTEQDMAFSMGRCLNTPPINLSKVRVPEEIMESGPARHGEGAQAGSGRAPRTASCSWRWPTRPTCSRSTT